MSKDKIAKNMDKIGKIKARKNKAVPLYLCNYANGHRVTALKIVHLMDDGEGRTPLHRHDFHELAVVLRGKGTHFAGSRALILRPGCVYLLSPGDTHYYEFSEPMVLLTFMFDKRVLRPFRADLARMPGYDRLFSTGAPEPEFRLNAKTLAELDILLNAIASESRQRVPGDDALLAAYLLQAFVLILRDMQHDDRFAYASGDIGAAVSFMQHHFGEEIALSRLARMVSLSESSFSRKFREEFGMPPMQWLQRLRIRKATEFLIRSDMTIAQIAQMTGFADPLYFSRLFRKVTGTTPRRYRTEDHGPLEIVRGSDSCRESR